MNTKKHYNNYQNNNSDMDKERYPKPQPPDRITMDEYCRAVGRLGLLRSVLIGMDYDKGTVHMFGVFITNIKFPDDAADPRYAELTKLSGQLRRDLKPEVSLRFSYINPSDSIRLEAECRDQGMQLMHRPISIDFS